MMITGMAKKVWHEFLWGKNRAAYRGWWDGTMTRKVIHDTFWVLLIIVTLVLVMMGLLRRFGPFFVAGEF